MQLTNIARDVYEDSKMKRIYLPANLIPDISLKNLTDLHNKNSEKDERISNAIHEVIGLSDKFYENGFAGLKYIPLSTRLGIFIAANVYRGIGIKIKSNKKKYLKDNIKNIKKIGFFSSGTGVEIYDQNKKKINFKKKGFCHF